MKQKYIKSLIICMGLSLLVMMMASCTDTSTGVRQAAKTEVTQIAKAEVAQAAETTGTPDWFFHDIVDIQFIRQYVTVPMDENVMIVDARPYKPKYFQGHIPMAVSIPDSQFDEMKDNLPKDKNALLIFYCEGPACKLSHKSARKAEALGYNNVKVFAEGFPGWMKAEGTYPSVSAEWLKKQMDDKADMVLVDSRPKRAKYDKGHIPTAISIPDTYFDDMKGQLPADKEKLLVFYCGGFDCKLSHKSAQKAIALGYKNVKVFAAGYPGWKEFVAGADSEGEAKTEVAKLKSGKEEGSIDIEYFKKVVSESAESVHLIDVRDADEFKKGSLKTAINIPVDTLKNHIKTLPTDKPVIFICGTGARSGESYYMVQDLRPEMKNVYYIDAGMKFNKDGSFTITQPGS